MPTSQSIIIYDWDDTLLCTSWLNSRQDAMNMKSEGALSQLKTLQDAVIALLTLSKPMGNNYIITNAMKGWVEYSGEKWIPEVMPHLEGIPIISARHEYEQKHPGNYH
jgi:hypothetical protein